MKRRQYLGGMATLGTFSAMSTVTTGAQSLATTRSIGESHHPGPPRVMHAGERLVDPLTPDYRGDGAPDGRSVLAPRIPDPERDPDNYASDAFTWRVVETPDGSEVTGFHSRSEEYDYGTNVAEFDPDVPGTYTLELDAPDGTHQLTVRVFPEPADGAAGPPRVDPVVTLDGDEFVVEATAAPAPESDTAPEALDVEFLVDDRDALSESDLTVEGNTARVAQSAIDGTGRIHVVAADDQPGILGTVELDADAGEATRPDTPPEWIHDSVMYLMFTRSFGSEAGEVDFQYLQNRVDYLADLGVDIVWLTPIVEAASHREDNPPGGPHGYDTTNYFQTTDALGSVEAYEAFVELCHEQDIRVCFDLVINHTDAQHRFFADADANGLDSKYYEWYERLADGTPNNYFGWTDLMNINYQDVAMREHILSVVDYWADIVDGFRCDIAYGVTHDFWKEVRQLVRAKDSDIFLLDEAIPYGPRFSEGEFDIHFDEVLNERVRSIGKGGVDAAALLDAVSERKNRGVPDHTVFLQYVENHDMTRYLDEAPRPAERASAGATFTLPGMPMLYYGQERAITEYSDPRVEERGHFRSFMNWEEYDEDHLQFYKNLVTARKEVPALRDGSELVGAYYESDSEQVVAYGRDAGDQKVVVVLNFADGTEKVALRGPVSTTDLVSGADVGVDGDDGRTYVEVDSVAVLETPSLSGLGSHVAGMDDATGDDHGPGSYTYPTAYPEGAFDITGLDLYESETDYQLRFTVDGPVVQDDGLAGQHFQIYVRDPTDSGGTEQAREGLDALLTENYQYRIVGDEDHGVRVESPGGEIVAGGALFASPSTNSIRLDIPNHAIPGGLSDKELAPLVLGYDPDAPGNVARVGESAGETAFGGGGENYPQVIDLVMPDDRTQADALEPDDGLAEIPYVVLGDPFDGELVEQWEDETGDDTGPGSYTYPTDEELQRGELDVEAFDIRKEGDRYRFTYHFATDISNPWTGQHGFSFHHLQVYLDNPASEAPTATDGRAGTNVAFESAYTHRIKVEGYEGESVVENGAGEVVTEDVSVGAYQALNAITVTVPREALGGEIDSASVAPLVFGFDPEGPGRVMQVEPEATKTSFGGASGTDAPAVVDMVTPEGVAQSDVLADGQAIPSLSLAGFSGTLLHSWDDAAGDDHGPGSYTYPTSDQVSQGTYDIRSVELYEVNDRYRFVYYLNSELTNPWAGADGFSLYDLQVYIRDPAAGNGVTSSTEAREGVNAKFTQPYHYRIAVNGYSRRVVESADGSAISQDVTAQGHPDLQAIAFDVPADAFEGDLSEMRFAPLCLAHDNYGTGKIRAVNAEAAEWRFGGGRDDEMNPNVIDMITPEDVSQSEALAFSAESQARLPFVPEAETNPGKPVALAEAPSSAFATTEVTLSASASSDPQDQSLDFEWTQTGGPNVELSDVTAAQPTFTASAVEEATAVAFELTATDPDGNSATSSTTVTIEPQSENDAPVVRTNGDQTVSPGDTVLLDGAASDDPNGGTLSFQWEQTGGPTVDLSNADSSGAAFTAPDVDGETTLTFEVAVADGQGKTVTDTVAITVRGNGGGSTGTDGGDTGSGFGPGFGAVSGALGTAGGLAYGARSLLDDAGESEGD